MIPFAYAEEYIISIPFGAYNPELNTPAEVWYDPPFVAIEAGDSITWVNDDREGHTVTSGQGSGRFGWMSDDYGTWDGLFESGRFMPSESWSFTFSDEGTFPYFCAIHPWMEGAVIVEPKIPDHPVDGFGNRIEEFPIIAFTTDRIIELDMTWEPNVIKTNEKVVFIYQTYDPFTNTNLDKMSYDIIIRQSGKELFRDEGLTSVGGDYRNFVFEEAGPVEIKFENIISWGTSGIQSEARSQPFWGTSGIQSEARSQPLHPSFRSIQFSTIVYENPEDVHVIPEITQPKQTLQLYYEFAVLIIIVPTILLLGIILYMKMKKPVFPTSGKKSTPI
jgi:plastocyanin